jgi:hypothetical protein
MEEIGTMSNSRDLPTTKSDTREYATQPITMDEPPTPKPRKRQTGHSVRKRPTPTSKLPQGLVARIIWGVVTLLIGGVLGALLTFTWLVWLAPGPQAPLPVTAGHGDVSLTMDDAFLTNVAQSAANNAGLPVPISNVHAHIQANDSIAITGDAGGFFFFGPTHFSAQAQPRVVNGHLTVHLLKGNVGGATAPATMLSALENSINQQLSSPAFSPTFNGVQYVVTGVSTTNGLMTVKLGPKLA